MSSHADEHLVRFLLGDLPEEEAEELDERSFSDDEFALRLRMIEDDLVDQYARGELPAASRERFDRLYRRSAHLRERVEFAGALHAVAGAAAPSPAVPAPRAPAWWRLAAAALVMAVVGALVVRDLRLRDQIDQLDASRVVLEQQDAELREQLAKARAAAVPRPSSTVSVLLLAPRRGPASEPPTVTIRSGTGQVSLRLQVESAGGSTFWAALKDPASGRIVWRSADLPAQADGDNRIVTMTVPVSALTAQLFLVELSGVRGGSSELIGQYPVRVVLE